MFWVKGVLKSAKTVMKIVENLFLNYSHLIKISVDNKEPQATHTVSPRGKSCQSSILKTFERPASSFFYQHSNKIYNFGERKYILYIKLTSNGLKNNFSITIKLLFFFSLFDKFRGKLNCRNVYIWDHFAPPPKKKSKMSSDSCNSS